MTFATTSHLFTDIAHVSGGANAAANPNDATQQLVDKFQSLMAHDTPHIPAVNPSEHTDKVTKAIEEQSGSAMQAQNDMLYLSQHLSTLSMQRLAAVNMTVELEMTRVGVDMEAKMATVQSSKDAIQTLMKNQ